MTAECDAEHPREKYKHMPAPVRIELHAAADSSFSNSVADGDAFTSAFVEFSPKWRAASSHIRGGSYNGTVVHKSLPE
jgi:hypothetical protein